MLLRMNQKYILSFILLLMLGIGKPTYAQSDNLRFVNFGVKDGLTDNFAYNATQDHLGFMWFATTSGLYRFDGTTFKYFRSPLDKPGRSISNVLQAVFTDKEGSIWLGGYNTLQWYNPAKNIFSGPHYDEAIIRKLCDSYIYNFTESDSAVFIATGKGYFFNFNKTDSTFKHFGNAFPSSASKTTIKVICANNFIWAIHAEGIYQFSNDGHLIHFYSFGKSDISNAIFSSNTNEILITTYASGLVKFSLNTFQFQLNNLANASLKQNNLFSIVQDKEKRIWMGAYVLFGLDKNENLSTIMGNKNTAFEMKASKIGGLFIDKDQNLWICGYTGLSMLPWQNRQISNIALTDKISGNTVEPIESISLPDNSLLISNTNTAGLIHIDSRTGFVSTIPNNLVSDINRKNISAVFNTPTGDIYASDGDNFFKYLPDQKKLVSFILLDQNGKKILNASKSVSDKKGNVFIGSVNNGFYVWNINKKVLVHYNKRDLVSDQSDNTLTPCIADQNDDVWFTSTSGVYKYNVEKKELFHYAYKDQAGIPSIGIANDIAQDKIGHFWITTFNNGLYELYFENGKEVLKNYSKSNRSGLPSDYFMDINPDKNDGCLWISYNSGLIKFDPITKSVRSNLTKQNGLYADIGSYSFQITNENKLIALQYGYLNSIDLAHYQFNTKKSDLRFTSIKSSDSELLYELDNRNAEIDLLHDQNFLQVEFALLNYNNANRNRYAYLLEGAGKDWNYLGAKTSISFANLQEGNYVLKIKAANNDGVWSEPLVLKINIAPPFYRTWWFITCMLLIVSFLVYFINRQKIRRIRKEDKLKFEFQQQIAQTEMKALRALMNPHFIFNSLNSIQKYILKGDHFEASQYLTKFSRLIRMILENNNQGNVLLANELELLKLYLEIEAQRFDGKFNYQINMDSTISMQEYEIPSMIIQPFVENAIWHGLLHLTKGDANELAKGNLTISFKRSEMNSMIVTIEDNGIGRKRSEELRSQQLVKKQSFGMSITSDRIRMINFTQNINMNCVVEVLTDALGNACGTKILLTMPIKKVNE